MKKLRVTVDGKAYDVLVEMFDDPEDHPSSRPSPLAAVGSVPVSAPAASAPRQSTPAAADGFVPSPMSGSIIKVLVENGAKVTAGQSVLVLEAMKMETQVSAPMDGTVSELSVTPGTTVEEGQPLFKLES